MWKVLAVMSSEAVWILLSFSLLSCSSLYSPHFFLPSSSLCPLSSVLSIPHHPLYVSESPPHPPVASLLWFSPQCCNHKSTFPPSPPCQRGSSWSPVFSLLILFSYLKSFTILPLLHPPHRWFFRYTVILTRELWFEWHLPFSLCCFSPFSIHYFF